MSPTAIPLVQGTTTARLIFAAFCETCERLVYVRSLLEDPRHQTRRQGTAMARVLREGLRSVQQQLQSLRPAILDDQPTAESAGRTLAGIGMAAAGLRQVHAHLGYLGTRWPLGTADLFVRKLIAEAVAVPVPALCVTDRPDDEAGELGAQLGERLRAIGLPLGRSTEQTPLLSLPTMDLLDPLAWPALLYGLAAAMIDAQQLAVQARGHAAADGHEDDGYRRACVAGIAARLVGESTYAACAVRALIARLSGGPSGYGLPLLYEYTVAYAQPIQPGAPETLAGYYHDLLARQQELGGGWGKVERDADEEARWPEAGDYAANRVPAPLLAGEDVLDALYQQLCDGRPINALPPTLPADFAEQLQAGIDAERFYALVHHANEQPCSLATILATGWRYKLRRTYPLCRDLMASTDSWGPAFEALAAHVLERSVLLQQSMEAAYVQQVFARGRDL